MPLVSFSFLVQAQNDYLSKYMKFLFVLKLIHNKFIAKVLHVCIPTILRGACVAGNAK